MSATAVHPGIVALGAFFVAAGATGHRSVTKAVTWCEDALPGARAQFRNIAGGLRGPGLFAYGDC